MKIIKRGYSANDDRLIGLLRYHARKIAIYLQIRRIPVPGDSIFVWIKEVGGELYPKIDIDSRNGYEIEYEFDPKDFSLLEPRFIQFVKVEHHYERKKIEKDDLPLELQNLHNNIMAALTT